MEQDHCLYRVKESNFKFYFLVCVLKVKFVQKSLDFVFWSSTVVFRFQNKQIKPKTLCVLVSDFGLSLWILQ